MVCQIQQPGGRRSARASEKHEPCSPLARNICRSLPRQMVPKHRDISPTAVLQVSKASPALSSCFLIADLLYLSPATLKPAPAVSNHPSSWKSISGVSASFANQREVSLEEEEKSQGLHRHGSKRLWAEGIHNAIIHIWG